MTFLTKQFAKAAAAEGEERLRILAEIGAKVDNTDIEHTEDLKDIFSDAVEFGLTTLRLRPTAFTRNLGVARSTVWKWHNEGKVAKSFAVKKQAIKWVISQGNPALMSYLTLDFERVVRATTTASRLEILSEIEQKLELPYISPLEIRNLFKDAVQFGYSVLSLSKEAFAAGLSLRPSTIYRWRHEDHVPRKPSQQKNAVSWVIEQARQKPVKVAKPR